MKNDAHIKSIAFLAAGASILQIGESLLPHPIPGIRFGLANMITLVALVRLGFRSALEVAILRTVVSSFVLGTFLSPAFVLSLSGVIASTATMGLVYRLFAASRLRLFSLIGVSLWGALANNAAQILFVYFFLIKHPGVFVFLPWLGICAIATGWITGSVAVYVCRRLDNPDRSAFKKWEGKAEGSEIFKSSYLAIDSAVHRASPALKISVVAALSVIMVCVDNAVVHIGLLVFMVTGMYMVNIPISAVLLRLRKLSWFIASSLFIPLFFNRQGIIIFNCGPLSITHEGLMTGLLYALRLIVMIVSAALLMMTTSPQALTGGLQKILAPVRLIGISNTRIAETLMLSLEALPVLWKKLYAGIRSLTPDEKRIKKLIPTLSGLIAALYRQVDL